MNGFVVLKKDYYEQANNRPVHKSFKLKVNWQQRLPDRDAYFFHPAQ